jgi:hypothetical protein
MNYCCYTTKDAVLLILSEFFPVSLSDVIYHYARQCGNTLLVEHCVVDPTYNFFRLEPTGTTIISYNSPKSVSWYKWNNQSKRLDLFVEHGASVYFGGKNDGIAALLTDDNGKVIKLWDCDHNLISMNTSLSFDGLYVVTEQDREKRVVVIKGEIVQLPSGDWVKFDTNLAIWWNQTHMLVYTNNKFHFTLKDNGIYFQKTGLILKKRQKWVNYEDVFQYPETWTEHACSNPLIPFLAPPAEQSSLHFEIAPRIFLVQIPQSQKSKCNYVGQLLPYCSVANNKDNKLSWTHEYDYRLNWGFWGGALLQKPGGKQKVFLLRDGALQPLFEQSAGQVAFVEETLTFVNLTTRTISVYQ